MAKYTSDEIELLYRKDIIYDEGLQEFVGSFYYCVECDCYFTNENDINETGVCAECANAIKEEGR